MSKPSELAEAADFAVAEMKAAKAGTFVMVWEAQGTMTVRTHPRSAALLRGVVDMLAEVLAPEGEPDDDGDE